MYFATVVCPTSMPSLSSSPWMRGAPHSGFAMLISRMSWRGLPAPIGSKAGAMPPDHRCRLEDFQRFQHMRRQIIECRKHQAVDIGEDWALRRLTTQHIELMSKGGSACNAARDRIQPGNETPNQ